MKAIGIIFSNIYDATMGDLTKHRTMASLPFGGRYRQIDFVLSNMVNSNIARIGVITKYNYQSLMDHLGSCSEWDLNRKNGGLYILPPYGTGHTSIYRGKLEALYGAVTFLEKANEDYVVMSDSTVLCNINFEKVLTAHIKSGADVTVIANHEKPESSRDRQDLVLKTEDNKVVDLTVNDEYDESVFCGMGMFVIERKMLLKAIYDSVAHGLFHFEKDYLQRQFLAHRITINVYPFERTVLRNRDISAYFRNNRLLMYQEVRRDIFREDAPIYTKVRDEVPTFYGEDAVVNNCLIADGCTINGTVENSVLFRDVTIEKGAVVKDSIVMQSSCICEGADIYYTILDKEVLITPGRTLMGSEATPLIINKEERV